MKHYSYVYITTCKINNKKYIGSRKVSHGINYFGSNSELQQDIIKYGPENFSVAILEFAESRKERAQKELFYIDKFNAIDDDKFYNKRRTSVFVDRQTSLYEDKKEKLRTTKRRDGTDKDKNNGNYGHYWSDEKRKELSERMRARKHSQGERNPMYGKKGDDAINGQKIVMCDAATLKPIRLFNTKALVMEFLNTVGHSALNKAIASGKPYRGYIWKSANAFEKLNYDKLKDNNWMF